MGRKTIGRRPPSRPRRKEAVAVGFIIGPITEQEWEMPLSLTQTQQCVLTANPVDAKGKPAAVDGAPVWTVTNPAVCSVTPDASGLSAVLKAQELGSALVTVTADADMSEGVRNISGSLDVQVVASEAVSITIVPGTPTEQETPVK